MSRDIVIVPTYDRPEYLALCLEKLLDANAGEDRQIWVVKDNHLGVGEDPQVFEQMTATFLVFNHFCPGRVRLIHREPHKTYGNSFNVLEAFQQAYATDARYVYLVEDDVLVMPDFFRWHEAAQGQFHPFVSCAGRINRSLNFETNGREAIDESCKDPLACCASGRAYGSWAACFERDTLGSILTDAGRSGFLSRISPGCEQDIFIQKLMPRCFSWNWGYTGETAGFSVWPYTPRAYHMGWYSYHRTAGLRFNGSLEEKVAALRSAVSDPAKIRAMACLQEIDPYPTQPLPEWSGPLFLKSDYR